MALESQQIKDMQSWYGTKADGIWGNKSTTAAGGRDAGAAYSLYISNKGRYNSYTDYMMTTTPTTSAPEGLKRAEIPV